MQAFSPSIRARSALSSHGETLEASTCETPDWQALGAYRNFLDSFSPMAVLILSNLAVAQVFFLRITKRLAYVTTGNVISRAPERLGQQAKRLNHR